MYIEQNVGSFVLVNIIWFVNKLTYDSHISVLFYIHHIPQFIFCSLTKIILSYVLQISNLMCSSISWYSSTRRQKIFLEDWSKTSIFEWKKDQSTRSWSNSSTIVMKHRSRPSRIFDSSARGWLEKLGFFENFQLLF